MLADGDESGFMNKVALAVKPHLPDGGDKADNAPAKPKGQSHVRQARPKTPQAKLPESGPMADMLRKLFGK